MKEDQPKFDDVEVVFEDVPEDVEEVEPMVEDYDAIDSMNNSNADEHNDDNDSHPDSDNGNPIFDLSTRSFVLTYCQDVLERRFGVEMAANLGNMSREEFYVVFNGLLGRANVPNESQPENMVEELHESDHESSKDDEDIEPDIDAICDLNKLDEVGDNSVSVDSVTARNYVLSHEPGFLRIFFGSKLATDLDKLTVNEFYNFSTELIGVINAVLGKTLENVAEDFEENNNTPKDDEVENLDSNVADEVSAPDNTLSPRHYIVRHGAKFVEFHFGTELAANIENIPIKWFYNAFDGLIAMINIAVKKNQNQEEDIRENDDDTPKTKTTTTFPSSDSPPDEPSSSSNMN